MIGHPVPAPGPAPGARKRKLDAANLGAAGAPAAVNVHVSCKKRAAVPGCHIECQQPANWGVWFVPTPLAPVTVAVGERVALRVMPDYGAMLANPVWALANHHVHGYTNIGDNALAVGNAAATATNLNLQILRCHWLDAGPKAVNLGISINGVAGVPLNDGVVINVVEPNVVNAWVRQNVTPSIRNHAGQRSLYLKSAMLNGVSMRLEASLAPCGGARQTTGRIAGIQLVDCRDYHIADTNQVAWGYAVLPPAVRNGPPAGPPAGQPYMQEALSQTGGAYMLDQVAPYANSVALNAGGANTRWEANDSPNLPLYPSLTKALADSRFQVYFMFKSSQAGSIWVTLRHAVWTWGGAVQRLAAGPAWPGPAGTPIAGANPPAAAVPLTVNAVAHAQNPAWNAIANGGLIDFVQYTNNPHL